MMGFIGRSAVAVVVLTFLQMLAGALLMRGATDGPPAFGWLIASNAIVAVVAVYLASRSGPDARARVALLVAVLFGIPADYLAEVLFFPIGAPRSMVLLWYLDNLLVACTFAAFLAWLVRRVAPSAAPPSPGGVPVLGLALSALTYVVVYLTAGLAAYPYLADHYAGRVLPSLSEIALVQVFRGLGFAAIGYVLVRTMAVSRLETCLAFGLVLSLIGGVAPLIIPSDYLPAAIRHVHLVEVGISNFFFGLAVGWLLTRPSDGRHRERVVASALA
jgi:hypothetical protein